MHKLLRRVAAAGPQESPNATPSPECSPPPPPSVIPQPALSLARCFTSRPAEAPSQNSDVSQLSPDEGAGVKSVFVIVEFPPHSCS